MPPTSAPETTAAATPVAIRVKVPQESGEIVITTYDTKTPHRYSVSGGLVEVTSQADADLLVARVDGAKIVS